MTRTIVFAVIAWSSVVSADAVTYRGSVDDSRPPPRTPYPRYDVEVELTYWPGMWGQPHDGGAPVVELLCPPGPALHHTCTSRQTCTRSAQFGLERLRVTLGRSGKLLDTWSGVYPIQTITRTYAPADKPCVVEYPTVAAPGDGGPVDVYLYVSTTLRYHLVLAPRAVLDPKSDRIAGYRLAGIDLPTNANFSGHQAIDFTLESRPDLQHAWNSAGSSGWILVDRVVRGGP